jgi:hypothetical protein
MGVREYGSTENESTENESTEYGSTRIRTSSSIGYPLTGIGIAESRQVAATEQCSLIVTLVLLAHQEKAVLSGWETP